MIRVVGGRPESVTLTSPRGGNGAQIGVGLLGSIDSIDHTENLASAGLSFCGRLLVPGRQELLLTFDNSWSQFLC